MQKKDGASDKTHFNKPEAKSPKTEKTDKTDSVPVNGEFARV
jgi:hypothetical protein